MYGFHVNREKTRKVYKNEEIHMTVWKKVDIQHIKSRVNESN